MDDYRFVADVHLAKLAKYLRLLGFDTLYFHTIADNELLKIANEQNRIILTKDQELSTRSDLVYLVQTQNIKEQLQEIIHHFHITHCDPFSRCLMDNTPLQPIQKEKIEDRLPAKVRKFYNKFWICPTCHRIYWHGSHYERMKDFIDEVCG